MLYTNKQLIKATCDATRLVLYFNLGKIDTLAFRKGAFSTMSLDEQKQVYDFAEKFLDAHPILKSIVKTHIDENEMFSSLYHNPPHRFRGSYNKVIIRSFAGIMSMSL